MRIDQALQANATLPAAALQLFLCDCRYPHIAEDEGHGESIELSPTYGDGPIASVSFANSENKAQLLVGADTSADVAWASATAKPWFRFSFTPPVSATYCVRPVVQLSGYWMLWAGASGACIEYPSLPVFGFEVEVRLKIEQLSDPVFNRSWSILNTVYDGRASGAFDYDSEVDEDLSIEVDLTAGDQAIVFVECTAKAYANNGINSRVDMQSSPFFYFAVPELRWGTPCNNRFLLPVVGSRG
jgi:hypothetical protein